MLNKKILLGSLVAGAFLLPMTANAGAVNGQCYNCHTMHQTDGTQNGQGNNRPGVTQLLIGDGCAECHAVAGDGNNASGLATTHAAHAPQVDDASAPNMAGYFETVGGTEENQHNIQTSLTGQGAPGGAAPGGTSTNDTCEGCHVLNAGGHHGTTPTYRMLFGVAAVAWVEDSAYGNTQTAWPDGNRETVYDSALMNNVCANCHGDFHGGGNQGSLVGGWVRHPTDVSLSDMDTNSAAVYSYDTNYNNSGFTSRIPVGTEGSFTDMVMCVTCHFAHGGPNANLLRFANYGAGGSENRAGETNTRSFGCESCHSYGVNGM